MPPPPPLPPPRSHLEAQYLTCMWRFQELDMYLFSSFSPYSMQLILGDHDVRVFEGSEQLLKTENIIWHPKQVLFFLRNKFLEISDICYYYVLYHISSFIKLKNVNKLLEYNGHRTMYNFSLSCLVTSYDYKTLDYDIMLIKLFHPVKVTDEVRPIPLPSGCPYDGMPCTVSGWGTIYADTCKIIYIHA